MSDKPIAIVTSVCPGTGSAIVRRFAADGFRVIAMARSPDRIRALEGELTWPTMSAAGVQRKSSLDSFPSSRGGSLPWSQV